MEATTIDMTVTKRGAKLKVQIAWQHTTQKKFWTINLLSPLFSDNFLLLYESVSLGKKRLEVKQPWRNHAVEILIIKKSGKLINHSK